MKFKQINWFALVGGVLILVLLPASIYFPWWQLIIGDNLLKVNVSPININFGLLSTQVTIPFIWSLNLASFLVFLTSGIIMVIYSFTPAKSYARDLLSFAYRKPLYAIILTVAGLLIITFAVRSAFGISIPLTGTGTVLLPSSLTMGINVSAVSSAAFQWPFWLAIVAAGLCITARIYHTKLSPTPNHTPQTAANTQITPAV
jgi:hypothetical protein